jgi:hypothetical protein
MEEERRIWSQYVTQYEEERSARKVDEFGMRDYQEKN